MTPSGSEFLVFVGAYTRREGRGISVFRFDAATGDAGPATLVAGAENPSFLTLDAAGEHLYAVAEVPEFEGQNGGAVSAYAVDRATGGLTFLNTQPTMGPGPCHVSIDQTGHAVIVTNYDGGSVVVLPVRSDGDLGEPSDFVQHEGASGVVPDRQEGPHAHSANLDLETGRVYVADLGQDRIIAYELDAVSGKLRADEALAVSLKPGAGPRHFDYHPDGAHAYVINELDSTITALSYDRAEGRLEPFQTVPALPGDFDGRSSCADIHVSADGRFVYGSNRGHDSIVIYAVEEETGRLEYVGHQSTGGRNPRNFALDPTGRFLLAANQDTDNIVAFAVDGDSGKLTPTGAEIAVSMPVCLKFVPAG